MVILSPLAYIDLMRLTFESHLNTKPFILISHSLHEVLWGRKVSIKVVEDDFTLYWTIDRFHWLVLQEKCDKNPDPSHL